MNLLGLIVEYNPFHNGHTYHLNESKRKTGATHSVALMSGNFVQRGEPAILDKQSRAEMAIRGGVDLVLELPTLYACQSAEFFASGAIRILNSLNCVDTVCFGSEIGSIDTLYSIAKIFTEEPTEYKNNLKSHLDKGLLFPVARNLALTEYISSNNIVLTDKNEDITPKSLAAILNDSNNILGIEYVKEIIKLQSDIKPFTIKRLKNDYNSKVLSGNISSATAIRTGLIRNLDSYSSATATGNNPAESMVDYEKSKAIVQDISMAIPQSSYNILKDNLDANMQIMSDELFFDILKTIVMRDKNILSDFFEVNEGIENKIFSEIFSAQSQQELCSAIKSKRYAMTKIKRILNNILLGITKDDMQIAKNTKSVPYVRVLGFNDKGREIIKKIKENSEVIIVNKFSNVDYHLGNPEFKTFIETDIKATNIYNSVYLKNAGCTLKGPQDYYVRPFYLKGK
ncbi:MAG: nucleotidyltransferase [Clostridioides sp.]|jgi:predicted nucleotidyltransferase|nr:nucleotidyltransferase [Clostridioides sp.]